MKVTQHNIHEPTSTGSFADRYFIATQEDRDGDHDQEVWHCRHCGCFFRPDVEAFCLARHEAFAAYFKEEFLKMMGELTDAYLHKGREGG